MDYSNDDYAGEQDSFASAGLIGWFLLLFGWALLMAIGVLAQMGMLH